MNKLYRQGDVLLVKIDAKASDIQDLTFQDPRGLVLAEGETSGHYHAVFGKHAKLANYKPSGERVVVVDKESADVRVVGGGSGGVDRHTPISLAPGNYLVRVQKTWTSENVRQVTD